MLDSTQALDYSSKQPKSLHRFKLIQVEAVKRQKPVSLGALDGGGIRSFQTSRIGSLAR